jgi:hypothetical protein
MTNLILNKKIETDRILKGEEQPKVVHSSSSEDDGGSGHARYPSPSHTRRRLPHEPPIPHQVGGTRCVAWPYRTALFHVSCCFSFYVKNVVRSLTRKSASMYTNF